MTYVQGDAPAEAIISGLLYRKADATLLAAFHRDHGDDDWSRLKEELYRTQSGRLFLSVSGGSTSVHSVDYLGGGQILPLSDSDAKEWLEFRGLVGEYIAIFGLPEAA